MSTLIEAIELLRRRGQAPTSGTVSVRNFLQRFRPSPPGSVRALFLKIFSGDGATVRRCGVPDPSAGGVHISAYGAPGGRWDRKNLTYNVNASGSGLAPGDVDTTMRTAFATWAALPWPSFTFTPVAGDADIIVRFGEKSWMIGSVTLAERAAQLVIPGPPIRAD